MSNQLADLLGVFARACAFGDVVARISAAEAIKDLFAAHEAAKPEPVAWGMHCEVSGQILDVICPDEHESYEGEYTIPLYAATVAVAEPMSWDQFVKACESEYAEDFAPEDFIDASDEERDEIMRVVRMVEAHHGIKEKP